MLVCRMRHLCATVDRDCTLRQAVTNVSDLVGIQARSAAVPTVALRAASIDTLPQRSVHITHLVDQLFQR